MNTYAILILLALVGEYLLHLMADLLNLKALKAELPREFVDVYDAERYRRSQDYERVNARFGLIPASFDLVLLLGFWFAGGFEWLDAAVRGFGFGAIFNGLLFIGALLAAKLVLGLPFSLAWVVGWVLATFVVLTVYNVTGAEND